MIFFLQQYTPHLDSQDMVRGADEIHGSALRKAFPKFDCV